MSTSQSNISQCTVGNTSQPSSPEADEQVIEKLFPKCRPKQSSNHHHLQQHTPSSLPSHHHHSHHQQQQQPASTGKVQHQSTSQHIQSQYNNRVSPEEVTRSDHTNSYHCTRSNSNNDRMNDCAFHTSNSNNCCDRHYPSPSRSNNGDSGLNLHLLSFSPVKSNSSLKTKDHGKHSSSSNCKNQYEFAHHRAQASFNSPRCMNEHSLTDQSKGPREATESYLISPTEKLNEIQVTLGHRERDRDRDRDRVDRIDRDHRDHRHHHHQERSCSEPTLEAPVVIPVSQGLFIHHQMHSTEPMAQSVTADASPEADENCVPMSARSLPCSPKAGEEEDASALNNNCVSHCLNHEVSESGHSTAQSSPAKEIARIIGNIPIALYEGSPRRYGLKNQPGNSQRILSLSSAASITPAGGKRASISLQDDDLYNVSSSCEMRDDLEELQDLDTALVDVNCDELVKSILSIPLPSSTLNNADALTDDCTVISPVKEEVEGKTNTSQSSLDKHQQPQPQPQQQQNEQQQADHQQHPHQLESPMLEQQFQPQNQQLQLQVNSSPSSSPFNSQGGEDASEGIRRSHSSDDPVISHESELILLHERVHQHLLQELSTPSAVMPSQLTASGSSASTTSRHACSEQQQQQQQQQQAGSSSCFKPISQHESTCATASSTSREDELPPTQISQAPLNAPPPPVAPDSGGGKIEESRNFTLSPETTECDSNEIESEYSLSSGSKLTHMPVLEDGLSSGIPSSDSEYEDIECNNSRSSVVGYIRKQLMFHNSNNTSKAVCGENVTCHYTQSNTKDDTHGGHKQQQQVNDSTTAFSPTDYTHATCLNQSNSPYNSHFSRDARQSKHHSSEGDVLYYEGRSDKSLNDSLVDGENRIKRHMDVSEGWASQDTSTGKMPRSKSLQMNNGNYIGSNGNGMNSSPCQIRNHSKSQDNAWRQSASNGGIDVPGMEKPDKPSNEEDCDTDQETDRLLGAQRSSADEKGSYEQKQQTTPIATSRKKNTSREVLIEGVLFRARYLGSTQLICEGQPTKATRMMQAEEAVSRIKTLAPDGEAQPSTEVDLFISTEKIMVLNTDLKEIVMDHSLRTISYIADIGDLLVLMARRRMTSGAEEKEIKRAPKMICHVFESEEAQFIAQSIGQAFQVAYMEFLKANGIEDSSFVKEMDYQEVLNSQEIFGDELEMFARKDKQKEVIVPKHKGEILGMVIVESGWGSMLPTVVIANMAHSSPAARCGHLNIGDQIIAINGISLVGLPLSTCQNYVKNTKNQTAVKLTVVPCPPVVEVKIKRPDTKYQLGFSVQNGVICSLLRGGIAERGGVRVGHRIIEINGQSVVAVPHERIVNLLATSVGEISMKTMPTSMFRLLTGQEAPAFI